MKSGGRPLPSGSRVRRSRTRSASANGSRRAKRPRGRKGRGVRPQGRSTRFRARPRRAWASPNSAARLARFLGRDDLVSEEQWYWCLDHNAAEPSTSFVSRGSALGSVSVARSGRALEREGRSPQRQVGRGKTPKWEGEKARNAERSARLERPARLEWPARSVTGLGSGGRGRWRRTGRAAGERVGVARGQAPARDKRGGQHPAEEQ